MGVMTTPYERDFESRIDRDRQRTAQVLREQVDPGWTVEIVPDDPGMWQVVGHPAFTGMRYGSAATAVNAVDHYDRRKASAAAEQQWRVRAQYERDVAILAESIRDEYDSAWDAVDVAFACTAVPAGIPNVDPTDEERERVWRLAFTVND